MTKTSQLTLAIAVAMVVLVADDNGSVVTQAQARIGRPATPGSVAGVARRTTRRAVRHGAYVGAAAGAAYYGRHCYRNSYGHLVCP
jgi:hypothetical protein